MGLVDRLKEEFDLQAEWVGFEIHPETPPAGMPLVSMFPGADVDAMTRRLNSIGGLYGLSIRKIVHIANSRLSLEAGEFAKDHGRFDRFHREVFRAYFSRGEDIGSIDTLTRIGTEAGLDPATLVQALKKGTFRRAVEEGKEEAHRLGISAAPTFLFNDRERIVGAQPIEVFQKLLRRL